MVVICIVKYWESTLTSSHEQEGMYSLHVVPKASGAGHRPACSGSSGLP